MDEDSERLKLGSAKAKFSRLITYIMSVDKEIREKLSTLSKNRTNKRWNDTWIRRNVWISLNSLATKHVRQAETWLKFPKNHILHNEKLSCTI